MKAYLLGASRILPAFLLSAFVVIAADTESVSIANSVEIPGGILKAGSYTFALEDRLSDRAIVRITNTEDSSDHHLLLSVPNPKMPETSGVQYFTLHSDNTKALRSWKCSSCASALEFVYPKLEAVKITDASADPVLAVDPAYDKLPDTLSADDMRVVTLWLLAPQRITADHLGEGVKAAKLAEAAPSATASHITSVGASDHPQVASAKRHGLPKTASNTSLFAVLGVLCMAGALSLRRRRSI